jgi:hypothetical protein
VSEKFCEDPKKVRRIPKGDLEDEELNNMYLILINELILINILLVLFKISIPP